MRRILTLAVGLGIVAGCDDPTGLPSIPCNNLLLTFSDAPADTVDLGDGLKYVDLEVGSGTQASTSTIVYTNYSLYTADDQALEETTCGSNASVWQVLPGSGGSIAAFEEGIVGEEGDGMRQGGVRRVFVPAARAFPGSGLGDVIFDIEFVGTP